MKLTKYGFQLNLFGFSSFLSVLGIVNSLLGVMAGIGVIVLTLFPKTQADPSASFIFSSILNGTGAAIIIIMIIYLVMWFLLMIKTAKKDIAGIETIAKVYSYISGAFEIFGMICVQIFGLIGLLLKVTETSIIFIIFSGVYLIFSCIKIHGIRLREGFNKKKVDIFPFGGRPLPPPKSEYIFFKFDI